LADEDAEDMATCITRHFYRHWHAAGPTDKKESSVRRVFTKDLIFTVLRVSLNLCMAVIGDVPTGDPP
jgi:hypothetical protein